MILSISTFFNEFVSETVGFATCEILLQPWINKDKQQNYSM